jgi:hypothetical protein
MLMPLQVANSHGPPRLTFIVGNFSADNDGVALANAFRPPLKRARIIVPSKHKAANQLATGHEHRHAIRRIYPHRRPALTLQVVEVDRGTEGQ